MSGGLVEPKFDRCAISIRATITPHLDYVGIPPGAIGHQTPQMHVTNRRLTHEERGHIAARLDAMLTRKRRRSRVITLVVVALVIAIFLFVFWITREPSSSAIMAGIGAYFSFMIWGQPTRTAADIAKEKGDIAKLSADLDAGLVTVSEIDVRRSLQVDSSILGTYEFYLDIGDGKVMFLAGDYLANFIATKQFPPRSISLSQCEFSRIRWELDFKGGLTVVRLRTPRTPALGREIFTLEEGGIRAVHFDDLAKGAYEETALAA